MHITSPLSSYLPLEKQSLKPRKTNAPAMGTINVKRNDAQMYKGSGK
jgi:hypothetical protein